MPLEIYIEKHLVKRVRELGGRAEKLHPLGRVGRSDRLVVIPDRRPFYCEVKRKGGRVAPKQLLEHARLRELGFPVYVVWDEAQIDEMLEIENGTQRPGRNGVTGDRAPVSDPR